MDTEEVTTQDYTLTMALPTIPMDVIESNNVPRLRTKSFLSLKCVRKSFNSLISSPELIYRHLRHSVSSNTNRLIILNLDNRGLHTFDFDSLDSSPSFYLHFPYAFNQKNRDVYTVGSCNGLLCFRSVSDKFMLINPFTGVYFDITFKDKSAFWSNLRFGFGFDCCSNDYKVVQLIVYDHRWHVIVYSLRANSWSLIKGVAPPQLVMSTTYSNGKDAALIDNHLLHWLFSCTLSPVKEHRIGCFDLRTEHWAENVPLPDYDEYKVDYNSKCHELGVLDGCLCLLIPMKSNQWPQPVDVWVMKEYGVKDSWVKLLGRMSDPCVTQTLRRCPLGYYSDEILLSRGARHLKPFVERVVLIWYNIKAKKTRLCEIHNVHGVGHFADTGSLVPLPGGKPLWRDNSKRI